MNKSLKILLAEDDYINQKVASITLKKLGYETDIVDNGKDAYLQQIAESYDVIFMDIQMPVWDGVQATKEIRKHEQENNVEKPVRIIAVTANVLDGRREEYLAAGMDLYISKPFQISDLQEALNNEE